MLLTEALSDLLDNAVQHGGPGLSRIAVTTWCESGQAMLSVEDNGHGLALEHAETGSAGSDRFRRARGPGLACRLAMRSRAAMAGGCAWSLWQREPGCCFPCVCKRDDVRARTFICR